MSKSINLLSKNIGYLLFLIVSLSVPKNAAAQIQPDNTLGVESSTITPNVMIDGLSSEQIEGGAIRGTNLFHSFQEFNVGEGRGIYFSNPTGIENILTRVTGNNVSNIFGKLGVLGKANLFLLNPNGIIFGAYSELDIRGSFIASTAPEIRFADNTIFSAKNATSAPLLTMSVPIGVQWGNTQPAKITNIGNLTVGKDLDLSGGSVISTGILSAPEGKITVTGSAGDVTVQQLNGLSATLESNQNLTLFGSSLHTQGDLQLQANNTIQIQNSQIDSGGLNFSFSNSGNINLTSQNGSILIQDTLIDSSTNAEGNAGKISVQAFDSILLDRSTIQAAVNNNATGNGQEINIKARSLSLTNNSLLIGRTFSSGRGSDINIEADAVLLENDSIIRTGTDNFGDSGTLNIQAQKVSLTSNSSIEADVNPRGIGRGGDVNFNVKGEVLLKGGNTAPTGESTRITAGGLSDSFGPGGNVKITAGSFIMEDGAIIKDSAQGTGNAGNIEINADIVDISGSVPLSGLPSGLFTSTDTDATAGNITVNSGIFKISNGALLSARSRGNGEGGNITVKATNSFEAISGGQLITTTFGLGKAGNISVDAANIILSGIDENYTDRIAKFFKDNSGFVANEIDNGAASGLYVSTEIGSTGNGGNIAINSNIFNIENNAVLDAKTAGSGQGGNITVNVNSFAALSGGQLLTTTTGSGRAGDIILGKPNSAIDTINISGTNSGLFANAEQKSSGDGGNIALYVGSLSLADNAKLGANTAGKGNAGSVIIQANDTVSFDRSSAATSVEAGAIGNGGNLNIMARSLSLTNGAQISANTAGKGDAGSVIIQANDTVSFDRSSVATSVEAGAIGNGGNLNIMARSLSLTNGAQISASTSGQGKAGNIEIGATESINISGKNSGVFASTKNSTTNVAEGVEVTENGDAEQLIDTAQDLTLGTPGTFVSTISGELLDENDADLYKIFLVGNKTFTATTVGTSSVDTQLFLFDANGQGVYANDDSNNSFQSTLSAEHPLTPIASGIYYLGISSFDNVPLSTDGEIFNSNSISSPTEAGLPLSNWSNTGTDSGTYQIQLRGIAVTVPKTLELQGGDGGNITLQTGVLNVSNGAQLAATTAGQGNAGNVTIVAKDVVSFDGASILTSVESGAVGKGGNLNITARSLLLTNGAELNSSTLGKGEAGNINITATNILQMTGASGLFTESASVGSAGGILVNTDRFQVADKAVLSAKTSGSGQGGSIIVNSNIFDAATGGQLLTTTSGSGRAGNITIKASDRFTLDNANTGLFASTAKNSTGNGGSINIDSPNQTLITNGAGVAVDSQGIGNGGNLRIKAGTLTLDSNAFLSAATANGEGGNITLQIQDLLLMRGNSNISATAGGIGNGGNLNIDAPFIVTFASENNDIIANAFEGRGGNIQIATSGIFGHQFRPRLTPESDITASSEFGVSGTVQITTPGINPAQGLNQLPSTPVDASKLVTSSCSSESRTASNKFVITGRGGLPPSPNETLNGETVLEDFVAIDRTATRTSTQKTREDLSLKSPIPDRIVEAQGWIVNAQGQIILTAQAPSATPHQPWQQAAKCSQP